MKRNQNKKNRKTEKNEPVQNAQKSEPISEEIKPAPKGIYTEYLDRNMNPDQLLAERKTQLKRISKLRDGRDILVYAADFRKGNVANITINNSDLTPLNDQISVLNGDRLDVILETPGGFGETAEDIVKLLRNKFKEVNFIVPGIAKSAGTIMTMSGDEILMEPVSGLGPIDAQISNQGKVFSADAFIKGLDDIKKEVNDHGLNKAYIPMLQSISPGEIRNAQNAMEFARRLVREWLVQYKFKNWKKRYSNGEEVTPEYRENRAKEIAAALSNHNEWLTHGRSIKIEDLRAMGLLITDYSENPELADAIRRYNILMNITFERTNIYKIYETPTSQIISHVNIQPQVPPQNLPKDAKSFDIDVDCGKCHEINKIQARFAKTEPIKTGFQNFPASNKFHCVKCGELHDLTKLRTEIERQTGKKIVT